MAVKNMQVLFTGTHINVDKGFCTFLVDPGKIVETPFVCYLIQADEGNIMVDTGMHPDIAKRFSQMLGADIVQRPEDLLPARLKAAGLKMEDINIVVMTHLHADHSGWLKYLKNAEVVVQKEEYGFAFELPPYARLFYVPDRYDPPDIKWKLIDGDKIIIPGITALFTPGHTPGSQSVMIDLPKSGPVLIVGDAGFFQESFQKELVPTSFASPRQSLLSIRKLNVLSQIMKAPIFTTHDADYMRKNIRLSPETYN